MNNTKKSLKVLFIGESWHIHMIHSKGYDSFTSSKYEEGATWLLQCLKNSQVDVTYMPAGNDSNLLIVFYVQIMPDDFV
ncbi:glutamine amidotransferase, partial [Escherichia coli]|uniref:glutamine amidotransferase n=2 Tax=Escherichia coli TaxID=562 RepID=UPI0023ED9838